jgi:hypothetical protein
MTTTVLNSKVEHWIRQGIATIRWGDVRLTPEVRDWMKDHLGQPIGGDLWWWDYYHEEHETAIFFRKREHAMMFKLTWL